METKAHPAANGPAGPGGVITNTAAPQLRRPRQFLSRAVADLRSCSVAGFVLFRAALNARHKRLWLSYLWLLLPGIVYAAIFMLIRASRIVVVPETPLPYPVFVLAGTYLWQSFVDSLTMPLQQFGTYRHFLANNAVAHEVVLYAGLLDQALNTAVRLALLLIVVLMAGMPPQAAWILLPVGAALIIALGFGLGLLISPLGLLYEDVGRAVALFAGFAVFLTPVFYPVPARSLFWLNPVTPLLEGTRGWLLGSSVDWPFYLVALGALLISAIAWALYRLAQPHLVARAG